MIVPTNKGWLLKQPRWSLFKNHHTLAPITAVTSNNITPATTSATINTNYNIYRNYHNNVNNAVRQMGEEPVRSSPF